MQTLKHSYTTYTHKACWGRNTPNINKACHNPKAHHTIHTQASTHRPDSRCSEQGLICHNPEAQLHNICMQGLFGMQHTKHTAA